MAAVLGTHCAVGSNEGKDMAPDTEWPAAYRMWYGWGLYEGCEYSERKIQKRKHRLALGKPGNISENVTRGCT